MGDINSYRRICSLIGEGDWTEQESTFMEQVEKIIHQESGLKDVSNDKANEEICPRCCGRGVNIDSDKCKTCNGTGNFINCVSNEVKE